MREGGKGEEGVSCGGGCTFLSRSCCEMFENLCLFPLFVKGRGVEGCVEAHTHAPKHTKTRQKVPKRTQAHRKAPKRTETHRNGVPTLNASARRRAWARWFEQYAALRRSIVLFLDRRGDRLGWSRLKDLVRKLQICSVPSLHLKFAK